MTQFIGVGDVQTLVRKTGIEAFIAGLADYIREDFVRWPEFEKAARVASHSTDGVIELMPASDDALYAFKYVNGHPKNPAARPDDRHRLRRPRRRRDRLSGAGLRDDPPHRAPHRRDLRRGRDGPRPPREPRHGHDRRRRAVRVPVARLQGAARHRGGPHLRHRPRGHRQVLRQPRGLRPHASSAPRPPPTPSAAPTSSPPAPPTRPARRSSRPR